ncbi:unnamed protein product [Gordionus sp. m RMFG-2023]
MLKIQTKRIRVLALAIHWNWKTARNNDAIKKNSCVTRTQCPFDTGAVPAPPPPVIADAPKGRRRPPPGARKGSETSSAPSVPILSSSPSLPLSLLPPSSINPPVLPGVTGPSNGPPARRARTLQLPNWLTVVNKFLRELRHQMFSPDNTEGNSDAPDSAVDDNQNPVRINPIVSPLSESDIPSFLSEDSGIHEWWTRSPLSDSLPSSSSADGSEAQSIVTALQDSIYSDDNDPGMPQVGSSLSPNIPGKIKEATNLSLIQEAKDLLLIQEAKDLKIQSRGIRSSSSLRKECIFMFTVFLQCDKLNVYSLDIVTFVKDHKNHDLDKKLYEMLSKQRRLSPIKKQIVEQAITFKANKVKIQEYVLNSGQMMTLRDIHNISAKLNKPSDNVLLDVINQLREDNGAVVEILENDSELLGIYFQDASMLHYLKYYPEVIFIDATYKLNNLGMPLFILLVIDSHGQSQIVALWLVKAESYFCVKNMCMMLGTR